MSAVALRLDQPATRVHYPDSDGEPMADNTRQFEKITLIQQNLDALLPGFVAGDLFWYPVEGAPHIRQAPDVLVALHRPKGHRGSYKQWEEDGAPPQVVFEIWSPRNTFPEMVRKLRFYNDYGVEEFYSYDPDRHQLAGWIRGPGGLTEIEQMHGWVSPRLGIRFQPTDDDLEIYGPDGRRFLTALELRQRAEAEAKRAEAEAKRAEAAEQRIAELEAQLRAMGKAPGP